MQLKLHTCEIEGGSAGKLAWKVLHFDEVAINPAPLTDASIDWTVDPQLKQAKVIWADGSCFPEFGDARLVLLALQSQGIYTMESDATRCESLARLCQWLEHCPAKELMLARIDAETILKNGWLQGSLVYDALKVLCSVEEKMLARWKRQTKRPTSFADLCQ